MSVDGELLEPLCLAAAADTTPKSSEDLVVRAIYDTFSFLSEKATNGASYPILEAEIQAVC